ncbi:tRNA (adenosine(37)-N6)-threonylcarbamoyltransferase complex dimerization subunit type 1 TsaB [Aquamicrobium zhengzhouense]|uniref:tRNA (Adenosine(37)-N6)-threonylcarbamoyltransferase complex dimerization subunit type 1 TsaB n=1 Tax=Aquamicrobium zhengzhouense TaxID=2781738 RepID=A0ABS0SDX7_9HYPH|nr:tRNA (adenosine(37)-N6)-threonylcarbamoyltransferase complex dimerization subunit type 1 TsaB [Aquamicrobium zhengzhouense]MBI1620979.1 tRNA (adenosine(37)-N6)-threonylcarbamoyltransferase complex dimerization subunit type 1 TsaB [Aquamicrobium zhengzhouense]
MIILAIDTAANLCAASVFDTQRGELGQHVLDLGKGHAEQLMGTIEAALAAAGVTYADLGAIAVSIGPGSFTGVRVGVSTARGLALTLKIPAVGVSTLEALASEAASGKSVIARIDAGRGQAYVARYSADGETEFGPAALSLDEADVMVASGEGEADIVEDKAASISVYARLAAAKLASGNAAPPKPLYLRDADAKPQTSFALPRKVAS